LSQGEVEDVGEHLFWLVSPCSAILSWSFVEVDTFKGRMWVFIVCIRPSQEAVKLFSPRSLSGVPAGKLRAQNELSISLQ